MCIRDSDHDDQGDQEREGDEADGVNAGAGHRGDLDQVVGLAPDLRRFQPLGDVLGLDLVHRRSGDGVGPLARDGPHLQDGARGHRGATGAERVQLGLGHPQTRVAHRHHPEGGVLEEALDPEGAGGLADRHGEGVAEPVATADLVDIGQPDRVGVAGLGRLDDVATAEVGVLIRDEEHQVLSLIHIFSRLR